MYEQFREEIPYIMLYAAVTVLAMIACCYLLFRRANAIAPDITPPVRLRRWTAAFFAVFVLNHVWYMWPTFFLTSSDDVLLANLLGGVIDCTTFFPVSIIVLLTMLQDRRRPLWPVALMVAPLVAGIVWCVATRSRALFPTMIAYLLLLSIGLIIYMVRALRQYGRWLRDNYADLEHKEVWKSFVVLAIMLLVFAFYVTSNQGFLYEYVLQGMVVVLICHLLWRVETLSDLSMPQQCIPPKSLPDSIEPLLQQYCIDTRLYLQHDLTLAQLAKAVGTNRSYLSQYFSSQGITYNAYINNLRIRHFVTLYHEAVASQRPFTAQRLAHESGYRSYSTFTLAFKQRMGKNVTAWMSNLPE